MRNKKRYKLTKNDLKLLRYLLINKVASREQINRDIYATYWPQSVRKRLYLLKADKLIKAIRPISTWVDQTSLYSLTSKGFHVIKPFIQTPLIYKRLESDSIEHDLTLVDIRHAFTSNRYVTKYFTENQIHNEETFQYSEEKKIFNQLRFDALIEFSKNSNNKVLIPIQYERTEKSKNRYKDILHNFYMESSIPAIIYITSSIKIEKAIKKAENEIEPNQDNQKLFYGATYKLSEGLNLTKFHAQGDKFINFS